MTSEAKDKSVTTLPVPVTRLDPRRHAFRSDLAAKSLAGLVTAPKYVEGKLVQVARPSVPLREKPEAAAEVQTEALFGEIVTLYDEADGWAWIQLTRDDYVGYVPTDTLSDDVHEPTHRVKALGTFVYATPDIKGPALSHLSINSRLTVEETDEQFCRLIGGGFVVARHITDQDRYDRDFVDVAERFIGTPYLWGGRTRIGIDCSGLIQIALESAGIPAPRDTDMQQLELGSTVLVPDNLDGLMRGDLVFWKGHVGVMADGIMMVHANAHHMAVTVETLPEAVDRIARAGSELATIKRFEHART